MSHRLKKEETLLNDKQGKKRKKALMMCSWNTTQVSLHKQNQHADPYLRNATKGQKRSPLFFFLLLKR